MQPKKMVKLVKKVAKNCQVNPKDSQSSRKMVKLAKKVGKVIDKIVYSWSKGSQDSRKKGPDSQKRQFQAAKTVVKLAKLTKKIVGSSQETVKLGKKVDKVLNEITKLVKKQSGQPKKNQIVKKTDCSRQQKKLSRWRS